MKSGKRSLLAAGALGCVLLLGWMAAHAQVASSNGNFRDATSQSQVNLLSVASGSDPLPLGGTQNRLAKFDTPIHLVDSAVEDSSLQVLVYKPLVVRAQLGSAIDSNSLDGVALRAVSHGSVGVEAESDTEAAVKGTSAQNHAILGISAEHFGVRGETKNSTGVGGIAVNGNGIGGGSDGASGVFGIGKRAGIFAGSVGIDGNLAVSGTKAFRIDHPFDPANQYLSHAAVESPDVLNLYSGNITTDASGDATIELPSYFSAINRDFRYQLTVIGQFAQAMVADEIANNRFTIKTDKPNVKVSWQVTGVRNDAWSRAHPFEVEQLKPEDERGTYQHPELFNQPEEQSLAWRLNPEMMQEMRAIRARKH